MLTHRTLPVLVALIDCIALCPLLLFSANRMQFRACVSPSKSDIGVCAGRQGHRGGDNYDINTEGVWGELHLSCCLPWTQRGVNSLSRFFLLERGGEKDEIMKWLVRQEGMLTTLFLHRYHFLPLSWGRRALLSVSHEYIINITIHCSYIFLITLVLQNIMSSEPLE